MEDDNGYSDDSLYKFMCNDWLGNYFTCFTCYILFSQKKIFGKRKAEIFVRCWIERIVNEVNLQRDGTELTLQMTMDLYVHVTEEFKREELKKLDSIFPAEKPG